MKAVRLKQLLIALSIGLGIVLLISAGISFKASQRYVHNMQALSAMFQAKDKSLLQFKKLAENLTFGKYSGFSKVKTKIKAKNRLIDQERFHMQDSALVFFGLSILGFIALSRFPNSRNCLLALMLFVSAISLTTGLLTSILSIVYYNDFPMLGNVIFSFESKGIATAIVSLFTFNPTNIFIGSFLFLFSIVFPVSKLLGFAMILCRRYFSLSAKVLGFFHKYGKYSMTDVFVVALFFFILATDNTSMAKADIQIGFYFFLYYVILSMLLNHLLLHSDRLRKQPVSDF